MSGSHLRPSRLPAANVASLCQALHLLLLRIHGSFDVPQAVDLMAAALVENSGIALVAVFVEEQGRRSLIGGSGIPAALAFGGDALSLLPSSVPAPDAGPWRRLAEATTSLDHGGTLRLASYGGLGSPDPAVAQEWLEVLRPVVFLALRQAQMALTLTQSSVELEAEVERRTREIVRLAESERGLLAQLRGQTKQLQAANDELRQLDEVKTAIISSVSHELRTPILTIKTLVNLLSRTDLPAHKQALYKNVINAECDRQTGLVNDLLELARLEGGVSGLERSPQHVATAVELVVGRMRATMEAAGQTVTVRVAAGPGTPIVAHPSELEQIVSNLVSNAHKFTDAGGTISILVEESPEAVTLCVADTGLGIPSGVLARIFETFYRVRRPTREIPGTGLGLAIVRRLVDSLGGSIQVISEEGRGSTFTVVWPKKETHEDARPAGG